MKPIAWLAAVGMAIAAANGRAEPAPARPPAPATAALPGKTVDYEYDGVDVGRRDLAWTGRAYVHPTAQSAQKPLPLVIFLHGLNKALIPHRWMGGGREGDVRRIVAGLMDRKEIGPVIVAGPGSVVASAVSHGASFRSFDLDRFVALTEHALAGIAVVDRHRIIVAGHSGAGCSLDGGLATLGGAKTRPHAVLSIDTCMPGGLAERLAKLAPETHVVVSWQSATWQSRGFSVFRKIFEREVAASPPKPGILRELDAQAPKPQKGVSPHDATVPMTLERWLPRLVPAP